jgi:uncharacterized protein YecE (DUF72 family)
VRLRTGTSGYSYKEWKGAFYPADLPAARFLAYYAEHLSAVEINNTFYRMPAAELCARWAAEVPEGFTFVLKAPQRITHRARLADVAGDVAHLWEVAQALGAHLGPILFQLPPYARKDLARLEAFLSGLPRGLRAVLEFRHASWDDGAVRDALSAAGAALCVADVDGAPAPPVHATARFGYLRLRRPDYDDAALAAWLERVRAEPWDEAFVFFKHEDAGAGPRLATRMAALAAG